VRSTAAAAAAAERNGTGVEWLGGENFGASFWLPPSRDFKF
jgi:hypothetical protein